MRLTAIFGLHSQTSIGMVWIRNDVIKVLRNRSFGVHGKQIQTYVVEASTHRFITTLTSTISVGEEIARTSTESLDDIAICRNGALCCTIDVQVDGRRTFVVYGVVTCILLCHGTGQDS